MSPTRRMRRQRQFRAVPPRRQRPTGGSAASRGRGSRGQGPAQVGRWGRTFSEMLLCCAASFHPVGTVGRSFPQNRIKQFFRHFSDNSFKLNKLNILTLQRLQKLQQKCIASSVKKGTLLRTSYLERMRKTMWTISPQKTSSLPSVLLRDPRIL